MPATMLRGKPVAEKLHAETAARASALRDQGITPHLATVQVGDDPASEVYLASKHRAAERAGIHSTPHELSAETDLHTLAALLDELNADPAVHGVIVQLPIPDHLEAFDAIDRIDPHKDVDGLHPENLGLLGQGRPRFVSATPQGVAAMLDFYGIEVAGEMVTIIGRSILVGRPLALLLGNRGSDATVVAAHSRTQELQRLCLDSDVLVVAAGRPGLVTPDMVRPGATVIDVGISRTEDGLAGDVDPAVAEVAGAMSPVPGGVGPLTVACLLRNTVAAAEMAAQG